MIRLAAAVAIGLLLGAFAIVRRGGHRVSAPLPNFDWEGW